ncbi:MAG TPA: glutamine-hydrolyzing carbamoyl-phosphate synthase small subunit [Dehalococcoidia bacterium]|nr:glutamine-hydrolyzing carbamoyl-phosphate synthase small subunit [Dehalococcoidia bacterium]
MNLANVNDLERSALLVLSDGRSFGGLARGLGSRVTGEVVFSTSMTGYQEALTDPSFAGQILTMTFPLQGNYGITDEADESERVQVEGFVVRELTDLPSHGSSVMSLNEYLTNNNILAMTGVDTRSLTRHLRSSGVLMGTITTDENLEEALFRLGSAPDYATADHVKSVSAPLLYEFNKKDFAPGDPILGEGNNPHVVVLDLGVKQNIMRLLQSRGCRVTVVPHITLPTDILSLRPDGVLLSPGPGDPELLGDVTRSVTELVGKIPMLGICLGHQVLAKVFCSKTYKMKFGHRGSNHPVIDTVSGKVHITSQNHGFAVDPDGLGADMQVTQVHLNDDSVEAMSHVTEPIFTLQYHSEASPGPNDTEFVFNEFVQFMSERM